MKRYAIIVFIVLFAAALNAAAPSIRMASLDIDIGARAVGMAGAFTAVADDASAIYYNPAGLSNIKMIEINGAYDRWFADSAFQYGIFALPVGYGSLGVMFTYTDFGTFTARNDYGVILTKEIKPFNICGGITYGAPIGDIFSAGVGFKYSNLTIEDYSAGLFLIDAGVMADIGDIATFGVSLQNLDTSFSNGYNVRGGAGINLFKNQANRVTADFDVKYSGQYGLSYSVGTEVNLIKIIAIRAGYNFKPENKVLSGLSGLSIGAGLTIDKISIDYAFTSRGDLGMTHMVGLRLLYESEDEKEKRKTRLENEFLASGDFNDGEQAFNEGKYREAMEHWESVKKMVPDYKGVDEALNRVMKLISTGGSMQKAELLYSDAMKAYEDGDYDKAVKKWTDVKKMFTNYKTIPNFKDLDSWLSSAREMKGNNKGVSKQAEKYFRDGFRLYNNCDYAGALDQWEKGLEVDPSSKKLAQCIAMTKARQQEIRDGIRKAKTDVSNDATMIEGVKRLRDISGVCPAYKDASEILSTLKQLISSKTRDYYFKGIEKYTEGNLDAAIIYWNNIEALDPKSEYLQKVKRYIVDARNKQKAVQNMKRK